ncbi:MAG: hypothetical protein JNL21_29320 [Myxococcales bacterium]|nr:hypothetical protein [Myxococcales bacterium]
MSSALFVQSRRTSQRALVPKESLVSLVARASARARFADLGFADPTAEEQLADLEGVTVEVCDAHLRATLLSTIAIDGIVRDFFARNPSGIAVAFHPGLCSRFSRVDNGELSWIDIDAPDIARLQCATLRTPARHAIATTCPSCRLGWLDAVDTAGVPFLFVHQGAARAAERFAAHFDGLVQRAPVGSEYVLDYDARLPLRPSRLGHDRASLELAAPDGSVIRYPRAKVITPESYPVSLRNEIEGLNGVSRFWRGVGVPSVAHIRFV